MNKLLSDKYFRDLDDFNKVLVPHKRAFFDKCQGLSFYNLLKSFSFNIDNNNNTFRWGKRYFSLQDKKFTWVTSNDGTMTTLVWDNINHRRVTKSIKAFFSNKMLKDHFLGCFSQNRKAKFYYKLNDFNKFTLEEYNNALININKVDGKTYGGSQLPHSNILLLDIDNYEDDKALKKLKDFLNHFNLKVKDLIFIEQNYFTGGIHCALVLPKPIENEDSYKNLENYCKNNVCKIECDFINGILRFPLSYEYVALKHDENILNYDEFVPQNYWEESFSSYFNNLNWNPIDSKKLINALNNIKEIQLVSKQELLLKTKEQKNKYWNTKKHIIRKIGKDSPIVLKTNKFHKITCGNRFKTMSKLIPYCKSLGYSLSEVVDIIYSVNEGSKDLGRWSSSQLSSNISSFYHNCKTFDIKPLKLNEYIKNTNQIPDITLKFLNDTNVQNYLLIKFITNYIKERKKHNEFFDHLSNEKIDILKKILPIMFIEIFGKMFYDINNPKEFIGNINEELGFQLPDCLIKHIQEYAIKATGIDSPIAKTSLQYLKKAIIATLGLQEISYKNSKRNWQIGSCKSFRIQSINDINVLLNHLYNSVYNNVVIKDYLNSCNILNISSIILYILLQQNQGFDVFTGEIFEKEDDPPPD